MEKKKKQKDDGYKTGKILEPYHHAISIYAAQKQIDIQKALNDVIAAGMKSCGIQPSV